MQRAKAPNRIDYIVLHRPKEAAQLVRKYGYEAPGTAMELCFTIKRLVRKKGEKMIRDLMNIHPDKNLTLQFTGHNTDESNYCGCNSAYTGELKDQLNRLSTMNAKELSDLYEDVKKQIKDKPEDKNLLGQVEMIWDEIRRKEKEKDNAEKKQQENDRQFWVYLVLAFFAGLLLRKIG